MRLVRTTIKWKFVLFSTAILIINSAHAQDNSIYSRYGLGDYFPGQNVITRSMAGAATAYTDGQSINFINPASYSNLKVVTYDLALTIESKTNRQVNPERTFKTNYFTPYYFAIGIPLQNVFEKKKWAQNAGFVFGLKPISKISYSNIERKRISNIDSLATLYDGTGGLNQAFIGFGKKWKNLSVGINTGYLFGRREINTRLEFLNDSVLYQKSNSGSKTNFGNFFLQAGLQYDVELNKNEALRFAFNGNLKYKLNATQDILRELYGYSSTSGDLVRIDSVKDVLNVKGTIQMPASSSFAIMYKKSVDDRFGNKSDKLLLTAEFETTNWSNYKFYNQTDKLINSSLLKLGAQWSIDPTSVTSYWSRVALRAGFYTGKDYINADGKELKITGLTFGAGLPIRKFRNYDNQFTLINTAFEIGKRGSNVNNITENYFKFSVGFCLSDIWFIKRKYD